MIRIAAAIGALILLAAALGLGYFAAIAARRNEGVFMPIGYVALLCLLGGALLVRVAARS